MLNESDATSNIPSGAVLLDHLGLIHIEGADAAKFIHGQLTQDFSLLDTHQARLAALCSPKGRMLASFIGYKDAAGNIFLVCSKDLIAATLKRLSMFVLRAKATLRDVSNDFCIYGVISPNSSTTWNKTVAADGSVTIQLYSALGIERQLLIAPLQHTAPPETALTQALWLWTEVRSGVATLSTSVADLLVPQMLNFESIGGVNFKKGCYPGQEVVARSQFRGTIKRRGYVVHSNSAMQSGDLIFSANDPEQEVGLVVQAAPSPTGGMDAIISCQIAAALQNELRLASAQGEKLALLPLGYALLEDI